MTRKFKRPVKAIFIGGSAGGVTAYNTIFKTLPDNFKIPIIAVLHVGDQDFIPTAFKTPKGMVLKEADEKEPILPGHIYFAPAGYHLLIEEDFTFSLSTEEKVQYARPSLDVTMETAAHAYKSELVGIVLTGANEDGANGLMMIKKRNGITIAQNPKEAEYDTMPNAAIKKASPDFIFTLAEIVAYLSQLEGIL